MIEIADRLTEDQRLQAGKIYYEAFRRKLQPLVGKPQSTLQVLTAGLNLDLAMGALVDGKLLGLAGLHNQAGVFSRVTWRSSIQHLGLLRGAYAWAVLNLFGAGANCPPGHLRIAALAVDASPAGRGWVLCCWKQSLPGLAPKGTRLCAWRWWIPILPPAGCTSAWALWRLRPILTRSPGPGWVFRRIR